MSFSKAKLTRFNDLPTGSAPDCMYDPKVEAKLPGGLIDKKMPRFVDRIDGTPGGSTKSETESIRSCKSVQLFRTPSLRRQIRKFTQNRVKPKVQTPASDDDTKELLWANSVEIQNKDETIAEQEKLIEEQKEELLLLHKEVSTLKLDHDSLKNNYHKLNEDHETEKNSLNDLLKKFNSLFPSDYNHQNVDDELKLVETFESLYESIESSSIENKETILSLKKELKFMSEQLENSNLEIEKHKQELNDMKANFENKESSLLKLNEDLQFELLTEKKKHEDKLVCNTREAALKMEYINEMHEMKVKELESCREIEKRQIVSEYTDKLNALEKDLRNEIELIQQTAVEKVQLAELTSEEKCKVMEMVMKDELEKEKQAWQSEFDKCQKIAETEIMQSEFEKLDLQSLVNTTTAQLQKEIQEKLALTKDLKDTRCEAVGLLERFNELNKEHKLYKVQAQADLKEAEEQYNKISNEKFIYEITLKAMRGTVAILSERLQNSDKDVENLKEEVAELSKQKIETEKANINYRAELALLQSKLIEYKVMLSNLTISSKLVLENNNAAAQNEEFLKIIDQMEMDTEDKIRHVNNKLIAKIDLLKSEANAEKKSLEIENETYKKQLEQTQKHLDEIYATLKVIDGVLVKMEVSVKEKDEIIADKDEEISSLKNQLFDKDEEIKMIQNENDFMQDNIESYDVILRGKEVIIDNLECELNNVREEFNEYQESMDEKLQELEEIECSSAKRENELQNKVDEQKLRITDLEAQVEESMALIGPFRDQLQNYEIERQALESQREQAAGDAREIAIKYAELLGHQNHKQKLKYVVKIKQQNLDLTEENNQLRLQLARLKANIEKLQKPHVSTATPTPGPKQFRKAKNLSQDIENAVSPKFVRDQRPRTALGLSPIMNDANKRE